MRATRYTRSFKLCDLSQEDIGFFVHNATPQKWRPSPRCRRALSKRLVKGTRGHLYIETAATPPATAAAAAAAAVAAAAVPAGTTSSTAVQGLSSSGGAGKKADRRPRVWFNKRRWLVRNLLYAWASGKTELFESDSFSIKATCNSGSCLAPGHMIHTASSQSDCLRRGRTAPAPAPPMV
jgi:hypothetical protein